MNEKTNVYEIIGAVVASVTAYYAGVKISKLTIKTVSKIKNTVKEKKSSKEEMEEIILDEEEDDDTIPEEKEED